FAVLCSCDTSSVNRRSGVICVEGVSFMIYRLVFCRTAASFNK
ncbi:MAG: hypothetical protein ACI8P9_003830, partial [Parasphingorhabdus sp.]